MHSLQNMEDKMKNTTLLIFGVVLAAAASQASPVYEPVLPIFKQPYGDGAESHIVGGQEAARGQFPHQAGIIINGRAFCGGSLISKNWVLTAGHCVYSFSDWAVSLGAHLIRESNEAGRVTLQSRSAIAHENFNAQTVRADIGVIKLPQDVSLSDRINVIALPPKSFVQRNFVGESVRVSGWGRVSDSATGISPSLQFVDLNIISTEECRSVYGGVIDNMKYCCSGAQRKGTCSGDSGGSLTVGQGSNLTHLAIVSFGAARGCSLGYPTGFTATPYYLDWLSSKTGIKVSE